jgi:transposase
MQPIPKHMRLKILAELDTGTVTVRSVAVKYQVSESWIRRLRQRRRETGETLPRKQRHGQMPTWMTHADAIRDAVRRKPDATLAELTTMVPLTISTLARALIQLGLTLKKSRSGPPSRIAPT